jgi:aminopeptidase N
MSIQTNAKLFINLLTTTTMLASPVVLADQQDFDKRTERTLRHHDFDVSHYKIDLTLEESNKSFNGKTTIEFSSTKDGLNNLVLDAETFVVQSVVDETGKTLSFTHQNGSLNVTLSKALNKGQTSSVFIHYLGENVDVDPTQFGMSVGYDLGLDFKAKTETNPQLINTLSFPEGARHWFPSFDHPSDWATHETIITTKDSYRANANGALIKETDNKNGTRTFHFSQKLPQPTYLYVLVAGPFSVIKDKHGDLPLAYWVHPGQEEKAKITFAKTGEMIGFFEKLYGTKFPWVKYDQITIPGIGGGAESTSATVLGESLVRDEQELKDFNSNGVISHEIAHQWWGDMIGYKDWTHVWLSESFATHGEHLWTTSDLGADEGAMNLNDKKNSYLREARSRFKRPMVTTKWDQPNHMFDNHSYARGGVVLNMFMDIVGAETFAEILKTFLMDHAYSPVTTEQFFETVKQVTGEDYGWFFDQWLLSPGHPVLEVTQHWNVDDKSMAVTIQQIQDTSKGVPLYRLPIKFGITTNKGKKVESFWMTKKQQTFILKMDSRPKFVHFDEGDKLLKEWTFNKSYYDLVFQLESDTMMGRYWAAEELGKHLSENQVKTILKDVSRDDDFWGVREKALQSLSMAPDKTIIPWLKDRANRDVKGRVRATAIKALGDYKNAGLGNFFMERYRNDQSYRVKAAAITALGQLHDPAHKGFIEKAAKVRTTRNVVERAAKAALKSY